MLGGTGVALSSVKQLDVALWLALWLLRILCLRYNTPQLTRNTFRPSMRRCRVRPNTAMLSS